MDGLGYFILSLEGLFIAVCLVLIVYLIFRRRRIKNEEDFEDRNN